jgi:hypothetical protein
MSSYCRSFTVWYSAAAKEGEAHEDSTDVVQKISYTNVNVQKHMHGLSIKSAMELIFIVPKYSWNVII